MPLMSRAQQNDTTAVDRNAPDFITASLCIADPGTILYSCVGHAFIRMQCPTYDMDLCFSSESDGIEDKFTSYLLGNLKMGMLRFKTSDFLQYFAEENRGVTEYVLNLSPQVKQNLWRILDNRFENGKNSPFDYINHGCAMECQDCLDEALDTLKIDIMQWPEAVKHSRREVGYITLQNHPWVRFMCMTFCAYEDKDLTTPRQRLMMPQDLAFAWQHAQIDGKPLISGSQMLLPHGPEQRATWFTPLLLSLFIMLLAVVNIWFGNRAITYSLIGLQTLIGVFMCFIVFVSTMPCTQWSWLLIPFNPMPVMMWKWRRKIAIPMAVIAICWSAFMAFYPERIVDWAHVVLAMIVAITNITIYKTEKQ